ncbi:MAG: efflux RND transporter periplasmic adaptor subunit [bacterium]
MKILKFVLPVLVLTAGVGGFLYFKANKAAPEPIKAANRAPVVAVQVVKKTSTSPGLILFGQIEAPSNSVLTAAVSADVLDVLVLEGSKVQSGDTLVSLDNIDVALEILQRKAELVEIEAQLESDRKRHEADKAALTREQALLSLSRKAVERSRTLARSSAGTEANLDSAIQQEQQQLLAITQRRLSIDDFESRQKLWKARLDKAEAALKKSELDLARTEIKAPYAGRVIDVMVSEGDRTTVGAKLVQLYDDTRLEVRTQVPSRYLPALQQVIDSAGTLQAKMMNNGHSVALELDRLSASVTPGQGGVDAFFKTAEGTLPALGTTVEISLDLPAIDQVVVLSTDALYGADRVYRVQDNTLRVLNVVRLGQRVDLDGRQLMILDGEPFSTGDMVLSSRLPQAIDGLEVKVRDADVN